MDGRPERDGRRASLFAVAAAWAPVLLTLALFAQVVLRGVRPALAERARLERAAAVLDERHARLRAQTDDLLALRRAHADPIYVERERRLLRLGPTR